MKEYKARSSTGLQDLMEWINGWVVGGFILHTFTHQENEEGLWYVAVLELTLEQNQEDEEK